MCPIKETMACFSCGSNFLGSRPGVFAALSRAAAKSASSRLRQLGIFQTRVDWAARATACERCPLRVTEGKMSYCGRPFLDKPRRIDAIDGCGCPTIAKAKDPTEHCPLDRSNRPASRHGGTCDCKWCQLTPIP